MYNLLYSKDALNLYTFLFVNSSLSKEEKQKIKKLICIIYMYTFQCLNKFDIIEIRKNIDLIPTVELLDSILVQDKNLNKMYEFYSVNGELKDVTIKEEYQRCYLILKKYIAEMDIKEYEKYIKVKESVDDIYQKLCNKMIDDNQLKLLSEEIESKLSYLEQYMESSDIEAYKTYLKYKQKNTRDFILPKLMFLFENQKGKIKFSELKQLEELKYNTKSSISLNDKHLEDVVLTINEQNKINKFCFKNIGIYLILIIVLYFFVGQLALKGFIYEKNDNFLILFIIWILFSVPYLIGIINYLVIILKNKSIIKGITGFVGDYYWSNKKYYVIYFSKYNESCSVNVNKCLGRKIMPTTMVKLIKIGNIKIVIPVD